MTKNHGLFTTCIALAFVATILLQAPTRGEIQNDLPGFSPNHVFDGALQGENVDIMTGNLSLTIPLGPRYQLNDWFGYQVKLHYNSKVWDNECNPNDQEDCPGVFTNSDTYGLGVSLHMGRIYQHERELSTVYRYQAPSGGTYLMKFPDNAAYPTTFTTDQGAYLVRRTSIAGGWTFEIHFGDGRIAYFNHHVDKPRWEGGGWYVTRIETVRRKAAPNDALPRHYIDISYVVDQFEENTDEIDNITDSAGRTIDFRGYSIDFPTINSGIATYDLILTNETVSDRFVPSGGSAATYTKQFLSEVRFPLLSIVNNEFHEFDYGFFGNLNYWRVPTGAEMFYKYRSFGTGARRPIISELYAKELRVNGESYWWTYNRSGAGVITDQDDVDPLDPVPLSASNPSSVRVLDPMNNLTVYYFWAYVYVPSSCDNEGCPATYLDGLLHTVSVYSGPAENDAHLVRRENYTHFFNDQGSISWVPLRTLSALAIADRKNSVPINVVQSEVVTTVPGGGLQPAKVITRESSDWTFTRPSRARMVKEYDGLSLYRSTYRDYAPDNDSHDHHTYVETYDAAGQLLTRTDKVLGVGDRLYCTVRRISGVGIDNLNACDDATLQLDPGDVATINTYDPNLGDRLMTTTKGGDTDSTHTRTYTYTNGFMETAQITDEDGVPVMFNGVSWFSANRTVDSNTGLVTNSTDPAGTFASYSWDSLGRLTEITPDAPDAPEQPTTITYDSLFQTTVRQDRSASNYTEEVYKYDALGRLIEQQRRNLDGGIDSQISQYDSMNRLTAQSTWSPVGTPDSQRAWIYYEYNLFPNPAAGAVGEPAFLSDPLGRISKVTRPDGYYTETQYDGLMTRVKSYGIQGTTGIINTTTEYLNDSMGRLIAVDSPDSPEGGADANYHYDEQDRLVYVELIDPNAGVGELAVQPRQFQYDRLGRLRFASNPENGTVEYQQYDATGKLVTYRDAAGNVFTNTYDAAGRLTTKSLGVQNLVENTYDAGVGFSAGAAAAKLTEQKSYQVLDGIPTLVQTKRLIYGTASESTACPAPPNTFLPEPAYSGLNGRLKSFDVQIAPLNDWIVTEACQNDLGATSVIKYPFENSTRTRTQVASRIKNGYLWEVADFARDIEYVSNVDYDSNGAITQIVRGNEMFLNIARDQQGRPLQYELWRKSGSTRETLTAALGCSGNSSPGLGGVDIIYCPPTPPETMEQIWDWGPYAYDGAGNIKQIGFDTFAYDELNRLVEANLNNNIVSTYGLDYQYDAFGNMTQRKKEININSGTFQTQDFNVKRATNRLIDQTVAGSTINYTFDQNGNMTVDGNKQLVFGPQNRLQEVWSSSGKKIAEYFYDASGYRVRTLTQSMETFFIRDGSGQVLSEFRRSEGETVSPGWNKDYIYALGQAVSMVKNELPSPLPRPSASNVSTSGLTVNWSSSPDPDIIRYMIVRTVNNPPGTTTWVTMGSTAITDTFDPAEVPDDPATTVEYTVHAIDNAFNEGPTSPTLLVRPFDCASPPATCGTPVPVTTGVGAIALDRAVRVTWAASTADDIWGYHVERKILSTGTWQRITPALLTYLEYLDVGLMNGTEYFYRIVAVDTSGNESAPSAEYSETPLDLVGPATPFGVKAIPGLNGLEIMVTWVPNAEDDIAGYFVHRTVSGTTVSIDFPKDHLDDDWCQPLCQFPDTVSLIQLTGYGIQAYDESSNLSATSAQVVAKPRNPAMTFPDGLSAVFVVDDGETSGTHSISGDCGFWETNDRVTVQLDWIYTGTDHIRIYRSEDLSDDFVLLTEITDPSGTYTDYAIDHYKYQYYVVAVTDTADPTESAADPDDPVVTAFDDYDLADLVTGNVFARDGEDLGLFGTYNAKARAIQVIWMPVPESQVIGYHIYRKCEWQHCWGVPFYSRDHYECDNSWIRLTDNPITTGVFYEDRAFDGLGGCFTYMVRAVTHDGFEGPVSKVIANITSNHGDDFDDENCKSQNDTTSYGYKDDPPAGLSDEYYDIYPLLIVPMDDERERIEGSTLGTGNPDEAPAAPQVVSIGTRWQQPIDNQVGNQGPSVFSRIEWMPNTESDLRGYHIERAGSIAGPWQRLTRYPVAWFDNVYYARGLNVNVGGEVLPAPLAGVNTEFFCHFFRVIAVDEDGKESAPGYYVDASGVPIGDFADCDPSPTLAAPANLTVATGSGINGCAYDLEWDDITNGNSLYQDYEYHVYRYVYDDSPAYFYVTERMPASACEYVDDEWTCTYTEEGESTSSCPWHWNSPDNYCGFPGYLNAFYVTIKSPTGGESPRSNLVFWDCDETPGYAKLDFESVPVRMSPHSLYTDFEAIAQNAPPVDAGTTVAIQKPLALESFYEPEVCLPLEEEQWEATGTLLTLGQSSTDPPVAILDIHVDHLGSTRVTTSDNGGIITEHNFMPFGEEILPVADVMTKMFTGHERDAETGLDYMMARYFSTVAERFLSPDPRTESAKLRIPQSWNRYSYTMNNPIVFVDLDGEDLTLAWDFSRVNYSSGLQAHIAEAANGQFERAGIRNVAYRLDGHTMSRGKLANYDFTIVIRVTPENISTTDEEVNGRSNFTRGYATVSSFNLSTSDGMDEGLEAFTNLMANLASHEVGHFFLQEYLYHETQAVRGTIMESRIVADIVAKVLRAFSKQDAAGIRDSVNSPQEDSDSSASSTKITDFDRPSGSGRKWAP